MMDAESKSRGNDNVSFWQFIMGMVALLFTILSAIYFNGLKMENRLTKLETQQSMTLQLFYIQNQLDDKRGEEWKPLNK